MLNQRPLADEDEEMSPAAERFVREAERRITALHERGAPDRFEDSNPWAVWNALHQAGRNRARLRFCEWGCGLGVAAGMAALQGHASCGVEIDPGLAEAAEGLHRDFGLPVRVLRRDYAKAPPAELVFAYPWPDEEERIKRLFEQKEAPGSRLLLYRGLEELVLFERTP